MTGWVAIKDFAADSIRAFSELEQASGAVESVFGKSANRIDRWAKSAASAIGLSEAQAKSSRRRRDSTDAEGSR